MNRRNESIAGWENWREIKERDGNEKRRVAGEETGVRWGESGK